MRLKTIIFSLLCVLFQGGCLLGIHSSNIAKNATFALESPTDTVAPGSELQVILSCQIDPGWHLYWKNTGGTGLAPTFDWQVPDGIRVQNISWPSPKRFEQAGTIFFGYDDNPKWLVTLFFTNEIPEGVYPITLSLFWISCNNACVPETQRITTSFEILHGAPKPPLPHNIEEVTRQLPQPIESCCATVERNFLSIQIPLAHMNVGTIKNIILYPEEENIVPIDKKVMWTVDPSNIQITSPLAHGAEKDLLEKKQFSGIIQLYTENPTAVLSYSIVTSVTSAPPPVEVVHEKLWKSIDPKAAVGASTEENAFVLFLTLAFLGGILLNVTPCVLPVVGMKILQLISYKNNKGPSIFLHGLAYTFGVLTTFWILAGILYSIQYAGTTVGWGFQLQEPRFVIVLIAILFCFALNLFGVFEIGTQVSAWAATAESTLKVTHGATEPRLFISFASGVLATIIATPCTGPFLGSVLGFAATIHPFAGFLTFSAIGLGVAFPFLVVTIFPRLIKILPKPGEWMVRLKQLFGFFIIITILWLIYVLQAEVSLLSFEVLTTGFLILAFGLWIYGSFATPLQGAFVRICAKALSFILVITGATILYSSVDNRPLVFVGNLLKPEDTISWEPFSEKRLEMELSQNQVVFVRFTAKWCLTCQLNKVVFAQSEVAEAFESYNIVPLEADWTDGDAKITRMLQSLGRNGVPVYAIFRKDQEPVLLDEVLTSNMIIEAVSED